MAVTRNTPSIGAVGTYVLATPFTLTEDIAHVCKAIRSFSEMEDSGDDVYALVYEANGLDSTVYQEDLEANVHIITLYGNDGVFTMVPDSYIESMPTGDYVNYGNVVIAMQLGALPLHLSYDDFISGVEALAVEHVGVSVETKVMYGVLKGSMITYSEHAQLELARAAARTAKMSTESKLATLKTENESLLQRLHNAESILRNAGLLS